MTQNTPRSQISPGSATLAERIAMMTAAAFLAILFLMHFLEPEFDPSWRMISEYELGNFGWLMQLAFFSWGGSVLAVMIALWPTLRTVGGKIGRIWLLLIAIAMIGAGIFKTNAITDNAVDTANSLHTVCGAFVIMTFPIAVSLVAGSLARNPAWANFRRELTWGTLLVWLAPLAFFASIIISNAVNPSAGRVGPHVLQGWPNRAMVVIYALWLIVIAQRAMIIKKQ
jgi:hypothetical protein